VLDVIALPMICQRVILFREIEGTFVCQNEREAL